MKTYKYLSLISLSLIVTACSGGQTSKNSSDTSITSIEPSIVDSVSSVVDSTTSVAPSVTSTSASFKSMELSTQNGLVVKFANKGAKIDSIEFEGKHIAQNGFIAGRVANRIAGATFTLNGQTYNLNKNEGNNQLHGGSKGFGELNWTLVEQTANTITFSLHSADGDMGHPGNMDVTTKYTLEESGALTFEVTAKSDKDTLFNPTNHLYMNMNGNQTNTNHDLWIDAATYTKTDRSLLPTGEIVSVQGTTLDYQNKNQFHGNNDSNLCLNGTGYRKVAEMDGLLTNYRVEVSTDRVGLQLYSDGKFICMEAQDYPDAIHHDNFPSVVLNANEEYYTKTTYKFTKIAK